MEKSLLGILLTDTHLKENNLEINISIFRQAAEYALKNNLNRIYHLGDVFDSRKAQSLVVLRDGFLTILDMLKQMGVELYVIPGNHDKTSYQSEASFLDPFREHSALILTTGVGKVETLEIDLYFIPFFSDDIYKEKLETIKTLKTKRNILLTHIGITGAVMNNGSAIDGVDQNLFDKFDQVFVGHYHDKQIFKDKFNYIGSSIQHNFGEGPEKGLTLLFDDLSFETHELEFPRYHKIEVYAKDLTLHDIEEIRKENESNHDNLRIVLIGDESEIKSFNKQALIQTGVSVTVKQETVDRKEVDERIEPFTSSGLLEEFDHFCKKNELNHDQGKKYLYKVLKIA